MLSVPLHKKCRAAFVTIPPSVLKSLDLKIGTELQIDVRNEALMMVAATPSKRKRYTLAHLLDGATPKSVKALNDDTAWPREGNLVGRELA
jgi:antitoxin component of MazEF toxin-antitoxin module